jgi:hypothetical protein
MYQKYFAQKLINIYWNILDKIKRKKANWLGHVV